MYRLAIDTSDHSMISMTAGSGIFDVRLVGPNFDQARGTVTGAHFRFCDPDIIAAHEAGQPQFVMFAGGEIPE
jgi:hypothetical protein